MHQQPACRRQLGPACVGGRDGTQIACQVPALITRSAATSSAPPQVDPPARRCRLGRLADVTKHLKTQAARFPPGSHAISLHTSKREGAGGTLRIPQLRMCTICSNLAELNPIENSCGIPLPLVTYLQEGGCSRHSQVSLLPGRCWLRCRGCHRHEVGETCAAAAPSESTPASWHRDGV